MSKERSTLEPLAYSVEEAAAVTTLGRTKMYQLIESGELASIRCGRRRLITRAALMAFLDALSAE